MEADKSVDEIRTDLGVIDREMVYAEQLANGWRAKTKDDQKKQETALKFIEMNQNLRLKIDELTGSMKNIMLKNMSQSKVKSITVNMDFNLRDKNEKLLKQSKVIARQKKQRAALREKINKIEETYDMDAVYNQIYEVESQNEQLENHIESLKRINEGQRQAAKTQVGGGEGLGLSSERDDFQIRQIQQLEDEIREQRKMYQKALVFKREKERKFQPTFLKLST